MDRRTRRVFLAQVGAVAMLPVLDRVAWAAPPDVPVLGEPPLTDAHYLALADRILERLNHTWVRHKASYSAGSLNVGVIYNAALLTVHATAAEAGHVDGRSRNDERARLLVDRLCDAPPFFVGPRGRRGKMYHSPGWVSDLDTFRSPQDKSIDPKVAEGLAAAWRAREVLSLTSAQVDRLAHCIDVVARDRFFRYPAVRLNQINWPAELYATAALVTGDPELLRRDYRLHLRRFVRGVRHPLDRGGTTNLGRGYQFHYLPHYPGADPSNLDSAEYGSMTLHALYPYEAALAAGMQPLPGGDIAILKNWVERVLFGYWTHSGMLNWDTGLGLARWMKAKTWAYAQQGLLTIAASRHFLRSPEYAGWAKFMFDRGLALYERTLVDGALRVYPSAHLYGTTTVHQSTGDQRIFSARMAANAARAVTLGLGRMRAPEPPGLYAFDRDTGRLAVSTPRYGTALVPDNRGAFPYGGIEPARLLDKSGRPVGGLGGRGPAAFGLVVRGRHGRMSTQGRTGELSLDRAPRGVFNELRVTGRVSGRDATITAAHRFTERFIETTWTIHRHGDVVVDAQFPTWRGAAIEAILRDGTVRRVGSGWMALDDVERFELGGYSVEVEGSRARAVHVAPQSTSPRPGPTLVVRVGSADRVRARVTVH
jgi:hypothetical protein